MERPPGELIAWDAVDNYLRPWVPSSFLKKPFKQMSSQSAWDSLRRVMIGLTIIRAHQHAIWAMKKKGAPR